MNTFTGKPQKSGFTLIELLVVIAIIAILAAILFPVFAKAREKARQTTCASNLKQLGVAITQYTQDYDEDYPGPNGAFFTTPGQGWGEEIYSYVKSSGTFVCPDDPTVPDAGYTVDSYFINENVTSKPSDPQYTAQGNNISIFSAPASTVLLGECQGLEAAFGTIPLGSNSSTGNGADSSGNGTGQNKWKPLGKAAGSDNRKYSSWIAHRPQLETTSGATALGNEANLGVHSGGANWLACDGHVKWLPGNQVSSGATPNAGINCPQDACLMTSGVTSGNGAGQSSATTDQMNGHPWVMTFSPF